MVLYLGLLIFFKAPEGRYYGSRLLVHVVHKAPAGRYYFNMKRYLFSDFLNLHFKIQKIK